MLSVVESQVYTPGGMNEGRGGSEKTDVRTVVRFESRFGGRATHTDGAGISGRGGWFSNWTTGSVQRSIELLGVKKMSDGGGGRREGMKVVLEQLRQRGFVGVIKEQRQGGWERWKRVWRMEGKERMED